MPNRFFTAIDARDIHSDTMGLDDLHQVVDEINAAGIADPGMLHKQPRLHLLGHLERFISEINSLLSPTDPGQHILSTALAPVTPLYVYTSVPADFDLLVSSGNGLELRAHLDSNLDIIAPVDSVQVVARAGGWQGFIAGKPAPGPVSIQHLLDGVAALLDTAATRMLEVFLAAGAAADPEVALSLREAAGPISLIREETNFMEDLSGDEAQRLEAVSDADLEQALRTAVSSPRGQQIEDRLYDTVDRKLIEVITELMAEEIAEIRNAAVRLALGQDVPLEASPLL